MVDFGRWVNEEYRVPGKPAQSEHSEPPVTPEGSREDNELHNREP